MFNRTLALLLTVTVTLPGCATTRRLDRVDAAPFNGVNAPRPQQGSQATSSATNQKLLADYVQKLPAGTRVRVHLADGRRQRGTLMNATAELVIIQPRTRIPEPAMQIPLDRVLAVDVETGNGNVAKAIGIGIAAGAGTFCGIFLILAAIYAD